MYAQLTKQVTNLRAHIDQACEADDGFLQARDLWDDHLVIAERCRKAGLEGQITQTQWQELVDSLVLCARLILGMKLDRHFYNPR